MSSRSLLVAGLAFALAGYAGAARAQDAAPSPAASPSAMDRLYDGHTHASLTPYVWGPTIHANFQFNVPTLPQKPGPGHLLQSSVSVGPSDYAPKLNSAFMFGFNVRHGPEELFGDVIYLNATTTSSFDTVLSGPKGHIHVPVSFNSSARLSQAIWEAAAGFSLAHGHNADLNLFVGARGIPINVNVGYDAVIGKRGLLEPSGSVSISEHVDSVIFGLNGKAFFGNDHWTIPYYIDAGVGATAQTWQAYTGAGYVFNHGQSLMAVYRTLNYNNFPADGHVQKLTLSGPLLGYQFGL